MLNRRGKKLRKCCNLERDTLKGIRDHLHLNPQTYLYSLVPSSKTNMKYLQVKLLPLPKLRMKITENIFVLFNIKVMGIQFLKISKFLPGIQKKGVRLFRLMSPIYFYATQGRRN